MYVNDLVIDFLCEKEVIREYTSDYTPQQNGVVEVAIREIKNTAVVFMNAANLHSQHAFLYGEAVQTATMILNDAHIVPITLNLLMRYLDVKVYL